MAMRPASLLLAIVVSAGLFACAEKSETPPVLPPADMCLSWRISDADHAWIFFEEDSDALTPSAQAVLDKNLPIWLRDEAVLELSGHADDTGPMHADLRISVRRAEAVKAYLAKAGIPARNMMTVGYGHSRPQENSPRGVPTARNRRVDVRVTAVGTSLYGEQKMACWEKVKKPYMEWYGRNCRSSPKPQREVDCRHVRDHFRIDD